MKDGNEATAKVADALDSLGINYLLAGSYSSAHKWTAEHGARELLDETRASIPPID